METDRFSLSQLQNWMQGMLVHSVPLTQSKEESPSATVEAIVNDSQRLNAAKHLDIYRYSYIARLRSCMQSQFRALSYALGNELFEMFADQYLDTYPSESYTLNTLGEKFAAFLAATRPDAEQEIKETWPDFMIELAGFEYALSVIFDQDISDNNINIPHDTPDELLRLTPVFHLFRHQYPICNYYLDYNQGKEPELPFPEESYCVVIRRNYKLGLFHLRKYQYYFLKEMQQHSTFEQASTHFIEAFNTEQSAFDKVWLEWKRTFIDAGFFDIENDPAPIKKHPSNNI